MGVERWSIPASWRWKSLGEIGVVVGGGTPSTRDPANFAENGYPWLTPADLSGYQGSHVSEGRRSLSEQGLASSGAVLLPPGSVLYSSRAPIGYCVIASNPIATSQGFKNLVLNPAMSPEYVREYLAGSAAYAESRASGTVFKELSGTKFASLRIPVPPPDEQRRIARRLGHLNGEIRKSADEVAAAVRLSGRLRSTLLRNAIDGSLTSSWRQSRPLEHSADLVARTPTPKQRRGSRGATDRVGEPGDALRVNGDEQPLPSGWSWQPLLRLARLESGHTPSRSIGAYWGGSIPWVGVRDAAAHHGRIIRETAQTITEEGLENSSARLLPEDSILLCRTAGSIGHVCRLGRPMATSQDFAAWVCGPALNPAYLMYLLMSERQTLRRLGRGTVHPTIYMPEIRAFSIALPPREEQDEIVSRLQVLLGELDQIDQKIEAARSLLPNLARRLHDRAFRGELEMVTEKDGLVDAALARHAPELEKKMPKRRSALRKPQEGPTPGEQLAARYDVWPSSGYSFEDLRSLINGSYEDVRAALFTELRAKRLVQRFDPHRRTMLIVKAGQ